MWALGAPVSRFSSGACGMGCSGHPTGPHGVAGESLGLAARVCKGKSECLAPVAQLIPSRARGPSRVAMQSWETEGLRQRGHGGQTPREWGAGGSCPAPERLMGLGGCGFGHSGGTGTAGHPARARARTASQGGRSTRFAGAGDEGRGARLPASAPQQPCSLAGRPLCLGSLIRGMGTTGASPEHL